MNNFIKRIRRVKLNDLLQLWKLPIAALAASIYRLKHPDLWIVCEDKMEARDNGYWMFKYICENVPDQECVYAIDYSSVDYDKVKRLGKTVRFGSVMHWIMYLASSKKLSSQKAGNPNAAIFYFLEVYGIIKDNRIFLQHGITINDAKWLYYNVTKMKRFICGALPEYEYVKEKFGYPAENVVYTGFPRFDGLHDFKSERIILIMPTWREWIADEDYRLLDYEGTTEIGKTNYFVKWNEFLSDDRLKTISEQHNVKFLFFPHRNMQKYMEYFPKSKSHLEILDRNAYDVQELLKQASLMITDYSSVFFDMVYMKKPIIFYQFDEEKFRSQQYQKGWFDYHDNKFGRSFRNKNEVLEELIRIVENKFQVSEQFLDEHAKIFELYDTENSERIYRLIDCK